MKGTNPIRPAVNDEGRTLQIVSIFPTIQGEGPNAGEPAVFIRLGGCNLACDFCDTEFERFAPMEVGEVVGRVNQLFPSPACGGGSGWGCPSSSQHYEEDRHPPLAPPASGRGIIKSLPAGGGGIERGSAHRRDSGLPRFARNDEAPSLTLPLRGRGLAVITGGEPLRQNIAPLCEALIARGFRVQIETNGTLWRPLPDAVEIVCSPKNTGKGYFPLRPDLLARTAALKFIVSASHPLYRDVPDVGQLQHGTPVFVQPMDEYDADKNAANRAHASALAQTHGYRLSLQLHKILGIE